MGSNNRDDEFVEVEPYPFPKWLLEQDPILANARENGIYMAFRGRRVRLSRLSRFLQFLKPQTPVKFVQLGTVIYFMLAGIVHLISNYVFPLPISGFMMLVFSGFFIGFFSTLARYFGKNFRIFDMPLKFKDLIGTSYTSQPFQDIWLAQTKRNEIAECEYIENRENDFQESKVAALAVFLVITVLLVIFQPRLHVVSLFFLIPAGITSHYLYCLGGILGMRPSTLGFIFSKVPKAKGMEGIFAKRFKKAESEKPSNARDGGCTFVIVIIIYVVAIIVFWVASFVGNDPPTKLGTTLIILLPLCLPCLGLGFYFHIIRLANKSLGLSVYNKWAGELAGIYIEAKMSNEDLDSPDERRWISEKFNAEGSGEPLEP